jgi:hypothetical protein
VPPGELQAGIAFSFAAFRIRGVWIRLSQGLAKLSNPKLNGRGPKMTLTEILRRYGIIKAQN